MKFFTRLKEVKLLSKVKNVKNVRNLSKSIKFKMILSLGTLIVIVCAGMGLISYYFASKALIANTDDMLPQLAAESALLIEDKIQGSFALLDVVAKNVSDAKLTKKEKFKKLKDQEIRGGYTMLGLANMNGTLTTSGNKTMNIEEMDFYQKAIKGEKAVSEPMLDIFGNSGGNLIVVYAVPIKLGSKVDSVLIAVKPGNEFSLLIQDITFGETGSAFMINPEGTMLAHTNMTLVYDKINYIKQAESDKSVKDLADTLTLMTQGNNGACSYTYQGVAKNPGNAPNKSTGWSIAVTGYKSEILSGLNAVRKSSVYLSLVFVILGVLLIFVITSSITNSVIAMVKNISLMASGDLTKDVSDKFLKKKDEIGILATSISTMQNFIRDMLNNIKDSSANIDRQSESLSAIAQDMSSASDNVTSAIQDVAKGAGAQAEDLTKMIENLNHFANELDNIVHAINDIDNNANNISSMAVESNSNMQSLVKSSDLINKSFKDFILRISGFGENVKQINEIANFINGIADQTNLLALNAAIEAARAGESGRGFAVVADHIRKLAEQTKTSSVNINTIIKGVSAETNTMVKTTGVLDGELDNQVTVLNTTILSFEKIINAINIIAPEIEAVNASAFELDGEKNSIIEKIEGVASIAQQVSASAEEIAASSEEMNASMEEVASSAEILTSKTQEMKIQVERFKI
ncbi:MAG: methyl-accepting chemotaxis sensory transducer with Cache sensor [Clostridiales bacterium]|nr:methyl-accepting chemotaxis sensory transducer with Cache sensor [Clostridiales bacterium]